MRNILSTVTACLLVMGAGSAIACDCPPPTVEKSLQSADAVFLFRVISASTIKAGDADATPRLVGGERVRGVILKAWKGPKGLGDAVEFRTPVASGGDCYMNTTNNPRWFNPNLKPDPGSLMFGSPLLEVKPDLSTWLVAAHGREPYALATCSITMPVVDFTASLFGQPLGAIEMLDRLVPPAQRPRSKLDLALHEPNNAFERPVTPPTSARGQRAPHLAPPARLGALRPAAQRER